MHRIHANNLSKGWYDGQASQLDSGAYQMLNYTLKCLKTNDEFEDDYTLHYTDNALIQAEYKKEFEPLDEKGSLEILRLAAH